MAANGVYGINIPVNVDVNKDVEILFAYSATRNADDVNFSTFEQLDSSLLQSVGLGESLNGYDSVVEGMYNLKLPVAKFNKVGIYTIYIKPKEIPVVLQDVGVLTTYEDVKGLIVDTTAVDETHKELFTTNNGLVGYRIIYLNNNLQRQQYYRIVTSNNKVEPVVQNLNNVNQKAVRYRYNENSSLTFITVTPSMTNTYNANSTPYIGTSTQKCLFVNTKFEPIMIELEMTNHDIETISTMLEGNQLRSIDNGLVTTFNGDNEIYHQTEHYSLKDQMTGKPVYEVRKQKTNNIDFTQTLNDK